MLSDEGSNSVQRQPQRLKALAQKLPDAVFITNLAQKPSAHLEVTWWVVVAKFATTAFLSNSPSSKIFFICREIVDLLRWNNSEISSKDFLQSIKQLIIFS